MLQHAKWIAVSLALHLAVASVLMAVSVRTGELPPETIMVVLDQIEPLPAALRTVAREPSRVVKTVSGPDKPSVKNLPGPPPVPPDQSRPVEEPVAAGPVAPSRLPESQQKRETTTTPPAQTSVGSSRPEPVKSPVASAQNPETAAEGRVTAEKAQQRYLKEHFSYIRDHIMKQVVYPPMARRMSWSGKVLVAFTIAEDGAVHSVRVAESSGYAILDTNALESVRRSAPFPKPPVRAEIVVPIHFRLMN